MCAISDRHVILALDGQRCRGRLEGAAVVLDDGRRVPEADAVFLAPVAPSKIIAVHLTYRSRIEEYRAPGRRGAPVVLHEAALDAERSPSDSCAARRGGSSSTTRASSRS